MLCIPLGHAGTLGSVQWLIWLLRVYSPGENRYGLLTKREVKMAGYWPSSYFVCLWTETKSRSINTQKKNLANIQAS